MRLDQVYVETIEPSLTHVEYDVPENETFLFMIISGQAVLVEDGHEHTQLAPCAFWTSIAPRARVKCSAGVRGWLLRASGDTIYNAIPLGFATTYIKRAVERASSFSLEEKTASDHIRALMSVLKENASGDDPLSVSIVSNALGVVFCSLLKTKPDHQDEGNLLPKRVVHEFRRLVDMHLQDHWTVERFASEIGVPRDHLQRAVQRSVGRSPSDYIQTRLAAKASSLLINSDLTVAEIAYRLGFSDAGYFNRFFKRRLGSPPGRYRMSREARTKASLPSDEFSAWP